MMKRSIFTLFALVFCLLSCGSSSDSPGNGTQGGDTGGGGSTMGGTIMLEDNQKNLSNPDMGWNQMYYTFDDVPVLTGNDKQDLLNWVPCDIMSFRLSWAKMEPQEGQYSWYLIDDAVSSWLAAGKRIAFKFYTNFLWDNSDRQATPLWVKDAGAKGHYLDGNGNHNDDSWMADYGDPIFLTKLENFYKAVAEHYKDKAVEFIEMGSIGRVGEGNSYQIGVEPTLEEQKTHINLLRKCFPNTQLIINDDYGEYACLYAKSVGFGIDDHSIGVDSSTNPPGRAYDKALIDQFHDGTTVIGLEDDTWLKPDAWYLQQMTEAHANYCRIHTSPSNLRPTAVRDIVNQMNLKMGYRIQFPKIELPKNITKGSTFNILYDIKNVGVGYCQVECYPKFIFKNKKGEVIASAIDKNFNHQSLMSASDNIVLTNKISIIIPSTCKDTSLDLCICMVDNKDKPIINLPYNNGQDKIYTVATISIK